MGQGYYTITRITDYGPYVTKIILPVPQTVKEGQVKPEQFSVYVERMDEKGEILSLRYRRKQRRERRFYHAGDGVRPADAAFRIDLRAEWL